MSLDKMVDSVQLDANLTAIANKIRSAGGISNTLSFPNDFISAIDELGREDLTVPKDVDFIDYDGRLIYSYTAEEFLALEELPANPVNKGLVAQGWNWTLADAKEIVEKCGALVIGQNYTTDTGRTRIYINIPSQPEGSQYKAEVRLISTVKNSPKIYWGDDTESIWTANANANGTITHYYSEPGHYIIEIEVLDGQISSFGGTGSNQKILGNNRIMYYMTKVEIGDNVTRFGYCPFRGAWNLQSISIPTTMTLMYDYNENVFESFHLGAVVFPKEFTTNRYRYMFMGSSAIKYISIPKGMHNCHIEGSQRLLRKFIMPSLEPYSGTAITVKPYEANCLTHYYVGGTYATIATDHCRSSALKKLWIPSTVTSIAATAFAYNYYLEEVHIEAETPPTLANVNAFSSVPSACIFYVPYSADHSILEAYKTATNWSTYASQMQEEPQS